MQGISPNFIGIRYLEHENLNAYRNYPLSESCVPQDTNGAEFAADVFVDAFIHPVVSGPSSIFLRSVKMPEGLVTLVVSGAKDDNPDKDGDALVLSGAESGGVVRLLDPRGRHAGALVCGPGWEREKASGRERLFTGMRFSSLACSPVIHNGVLSLSDEEGTQRTTRRHVIFRGDTQIRPYLVDGPRGKRLYFDAIPLEEKGGDTPIRRIVFANRGRAILRASREYASSNTVFVTAAPFFDKEDVCWQVHKEDAVATVVDTCENPDDSGGAGCNPGTIPPTYDFFGVCVDPMGNVNLISENTVDYKNPVTIGVVDGTVFPVALSLSPNMSTDDAVEEGSRLAERPVSMGNGIRISIPGLKA